MKGSGIKQEEGLKAEVVRGKNPRRQVVVEHRRDSGGEWQEIFHRERWQSGRFHREQEGGSMARQEAQAWVDDPGADEGR